MKKVFFAAVAVLALASCKKDYECKFGSGSNTPTITYTKLDKSQADTAKSQCTLVGGTFSAK